jgi:hypothetical protein
VEDVSGQILGDFFNQQIAARRARRSSFPVPHAQRLRHQGAAARAITPGWVTCCCTAVTRQSGVKQVHTGNRPAAHAGARLESETYRFPTSRISAPNFYGYLF